MRSKNKLPSCCGSEAYVYVLETPILKEHIKLFEDAGFRALNHFLKVGILNAKKKSLSFTVSFGQTKMTTRCSGKNCPVLWAEFDKIISEIEKDKRI